ncbi:MAG: hypothetical protein SF097_09085 [Acidobacteriota bacterium]|nr:hypothetical protein [Acidobacteriota bacterium]
MRDNIDRFTDARSRDLTGMLAIGGSAGSDSIRYTYQQQCVARLYAQPIDGGSQIPLTRFQRDFIFRFAFSPDGLTSVSERGRRVRDAVLFKTTP